MLKERISASELIPGASSDNYIELINNNEKIDFSLVKAAIINAIKKIAGNDKGIDTLTTNPLNDGKILKITNNGPIYNPQTGMRMYGQSFPERNEIQIDLELIKNQIDGPLEPVK